MAFTNETSFIDGLKSTPDQKKAIEALFNDPDFKKIWNYLKNCQKEIVLKSVPGHKTEGVERFGSYEDEGSKGTLTINPTKREHTDNPMELVDTLIHECIHAVMDLRADCGDTNYPFGKEITELYKDPNIKGIPTNEKKHVDPRDKDYMEKHYGDGASNPTDEFIDINDEGQRLIIKIIERLMKKTKVGKKTLTFNNEAKRNPKKPKKGCLMLLTSFTFIMVILFLCILD